MSWKKFGPYNQPNQDEVVETCVIDEGGQRMESKHLWRNYRWWTPDGEMYIYYNPTHWKRIN